MTAPRLVLVDWARAVGDRVPLLENDGPAFQLGEPVVTVREDQTIRGMVGWDLSLGFVCIITTAPGAETAGSEGPAPPA